MIRAIKKWLGIEPAPEPEPRIPLPFKADEVRSVPFASTLSDRTVLFWNPRKKALDLGIIHHYRDEDHVHPVFEGKVYDCEGGFTALLLCEPPHSVMRRMGFEEEPLTEEEKYNGTVARFKT